MSLLTRFGCREPQADAPREQHERYARMHGYFWLPCPVCSEWFGGHERPNGFARYPGMEPGRSTCTCPNCPGQWYIRAERVEGDHFHFDPVPCSEESNE